MRGINSAADLAHKAKMSTPLLINRNVMRGLYLKMPIKFNLSEKAPRVKVHLEEVDWFGL